MPDGTHLNVMIDPFDVDAVVRADPESCAELLWGKEVRGVRVSLPKASPAMIEELLGTAWKRRAPKRLSTYAGFSPRYSVCLPISHHSGGKER